MRFWKLFLIIALMLMIKPLWADVRILSTSPVLNISEDVVVQYSNSPFGITISPDGRYLLSTDYGPGSAQYNLHVYDLKGKAAPLVLPYTRNGVFISDNQFLYQSYDLAGWYEWIIQPLPEGPKRVIFKSNTEYPRIDSVFVGNASKTGEIICVRMLSQNKSDVCAIRIRDGRIRALRSSIPYGIEGAAFSPDGRRIAFTVQQPTVYAPTLEPDHSVTIPIVCITGVYDGPVQRLTSGYVYEWLTGSKDLLINRDEGLFRFDLRNHEMHYLGNQVGILSPSRKWMVIRSESDSYIISTHDGSRYNIPLKDAKMFFFGRSDHELYYRMTDGWYKAQISIELSGIPLVMPKFEDLMLNLPPNQPMRMNNISQPQKDWDIFSSKSEVLCMAHVKDEIWLGTSGGLRVLNLNGKEKLLKPWQSALTGKRIEVITVSGDKVWLTTYQPDINYANSGVDSIIKVPLSGNGIPQESVEKDYWNRGGYTNLLVSGQKGLLAYSLEGIIRIWDITAGVEALPTQQQRFDLNIFQILDGIVSKDGSLWLGTGGGVIQWRIGKPSARKWDEMQGLPSNMVLSVLEDGNRLWIGTAAGLRVMGIPDQKIRYASISDQIGVFPVWQIIAAGQKRFFLTTGYLTVLDSHNHLQRWKLPSKETAKLFTDGKRIFAVFGKNSPLMVFDGNGKWKKFYDSANGQLASNTIRDIAVGHGKLWCGTDSGLSAIDISSGRVTNPAIQQGAKNIQTLATDGSSVWISPFDGGLWRYDLKSGNTSKILQKPGPVPGKQGVWSGLWGVFNSLYVDSTYVYGNTLNGFTRLIKANRDAKWVPLPSSGTVTAAQPVCINNEPFMISVLYKWPSLSMLKVRVKDLSIEPVWSEIKISWNDLLASTGDSIWLQQQQQLRLLKPDGSVIYDFQLPPEAAQSYERHMAVGRNGDVWITATNEQKMDTILWRLNPASGEWKHWQSPLPAATGVLPDVNSVWVATGSGVARLRLEDKKKRCLFIVWHFDPIPPVASVPESDCKEDVGTEAGPVYF